LVLEVSEISELVNKVNRVSEVSEIITEQQGGVSALFFIQQIINKNM
jgi:hypothetical protein